MKEKQDEFQQAMNQGHSAAWDQMWDKAAAYYRQALAILPGNPGALTSLGLALIELQEYEQSLECYIQAAKALPDDPLPLEKVAQLYERMGGLDQASQASLRVADLYLKNRDTSKAMENWERVTRLNPENQQAHSRLAMVLERLGDKERAVSEYLALASLLQSSGDIEKASQTINMALKVDPDHPEAKEALRLLKDFKPLPKLVRPRGATAPLRMSQVRRLAPQPESAHDEPGLDPVVETCQRALTLLAGMLFEGADDDARPEGRRGLKAIVTGTTGMLRRPTDRRRMMVHLSTLVDFQAQSQYAQAADELQRAMDVGLDHAAAHFDLGYLYVQVGRLESAIRHLQQSLRKEEFALGAHLLLGHVFRKREKLPEATTEYLQALKIADAQMVAEEDANDLRQLYEPLIEEQRQNDDETAMQRICDNVHGLLMRPDWRIHLKRARQQLPKHGGRVQAKQMPLPLAEMITQSHSSQLIDSISAIYEMMSKGYNRSAMEEAYFALQGAPTYLPLHVLLAELLVKQEEITEASTKMQVIANTYSARGERQQAISMCRRVVELVPADLNARGRLIEHLLEAGEHEEAIKEYIQLADLYYSLADLNKARKIFTDALRSAQQPDVDPNLRVRILHRMADIDRQSLDWRQALRIYEQIRTVNPEDEEARTSLVELNFRLGQEQQALGELDNYLAYLTSNAQKSKALAFMEGLTNSYPERISIRRRLADLYRHLGRKSDAITQFNAIGELLLDANDTAGAIQVIENILDLDPPNKEDYHELLGQLRKR